MKYVLFVLTITLVGPCILASLLFYLIGVASRLGILQFFDRIEEAVEQTFHPLVVAVGETFVIAGLIFAATFLLPLFIDYLDSVLI